MCHVVCLSHTPLLSLPPSLSRVASLAMDIYAWQKLRRVEPHEIALKANELEIKDNLVLELKIVRALCLCCFFCGYAKGTAKVFNLPKRRRQRKHENGQ